jgi:hypothetical protein
MTLVPAFVTDASALNPQPAGIQGVLRDNAVTTTAVSFDLTAWAGRVVVIAVTGAADYRFATTTGASLDIATEHATASTASTTGANIAGILPAAGRWPFTVPRTNGQGNAATGRIFLRIASVTGTIDVAVEPG